MSKADTKRYSQADIDKLLSAGADETDWQRLAALTEDERIAAVASDPDARMPDAAFWDKAEVRMPLRIAKKHLNIRVDEDVLSWFQEQGKGYQTRMNAVLRSYMEAKRKESQA